MHKLIFALAVVAAFEAGRLVPTALPVADSRGTALYAQAADPCVEIIAGDPASQAAQECRVRLRVLQDPSGFVDRVSDRVAQEGLSRLEARVLERAQELNVRYTAVLNKIERRLQESLDETEDLLDESEDVLEDSLDVLEESEDALEDTEEALDQGEQKVEDLRDLVDELRARLGISDGDNDNDGGDDNDNA